MNPIKTSRDTETPKADRTATSLEPGALYLVATPIGNLRDISYRALDVLRGADWLLAEDTRRTRKLLSHFGIAARPISFHEHNERRQLGRVLERLQAGASVALVSDAGTPSISDPGFRLVRAAVEAGLTVVPVPGPSAPLAALVASGLPTDRFFFAGYPPRKAGERERFFRSLRAVPGTLLLLESPRRLQSTLETASLVLGEKRPAAVARELTKAHEEFLRGTLADILERLHDRPLRGEVTLCIGPAKDIAPAQPTWTTCQVVARYDLLVADGIERRKAQRTVARESGIPRRDVYRMLFEKHPTPPPSDGENPT